MRKMLTSFLALSITSSTLAGTIMPDMKRNKKESNDSALGVAWAKRNAVGLIYANLSSEVEVLGDKTFDSDASALAPYVFFHNDSFSTEVGFIKSKIETDPVDGDTSKADVDSLDANVAFRTTENLALVAGFSTSSVVEDDEESDKETTKGLTLGFSGDFGNGVILGASYSFNNYGTDTVDVSYNSYTIGAGHQAWNGSNGHSVEVYYSKQNAEKETTFAAGSASVGEVSTIGLSGLYAIDSIEVSAAFEFGNSKNYDETEETDSTSLEVNLEYLVTENFYLTPGFSMAKAENTDSSGSDNIITDTDSLSYQLTAGYRTAEMDLSFSFGKLSADETETDEDKEETSGTLLGANLAYFF